MGLMGLKVRRNWVYTSFIDQERRDKIKYKILRRIGQTESNANKDTLAAVDES